MADAKMALAAARRAEQKQIGAVVQPLVAGGQRHDLGLGDHRHGLEVEGIECLARQQAGFDQMAFDAAPVTLGEFVFGHGQQQAGSGPAFLVGAFGELRPDHLDGGQSQLVEQQPKLAGIDGIVRASCGTAGAEQRLVGVERAQRERPRWAAGWDPARSAPATHPYRAARRACKAASSVLGQFGFAAAVVRQGQQLDHRAAGLAWRQVLHEGVEGSTVRLAREELVAVDQVQQRHRLAAQ